MFRNYYEPAPYVSGYPLELALELVVPVGADVTNLSTNPSVEVNTTGWTAVGGSISQSTLNQRRGVYSVRVVPTAAGTDGVYSDGGLSLTLGTVYSVSFDFLGREGVSYRTQMHTTGAIGLHQNVLITGKGYWERIHFFYPEITASAARRLYITKINSTDTQPFYVDGLLVAASSDKLTYFDGDSKGYTANRQEFYWTGVPHASTSVMTAQTRAAGKLIPLANYGFVLLALMGMGMQPVTNISQPLAISGGSLYQRTTKPSRAFDVVGFMAAATRQKLERDLASLIYDLERDRVPYDQPIVIQYQSVDECGVANGERIIIPCSYAGGLEGVRDNNHRANIDLKFESYLPYMAALDGTDGETISPYSQLTANRILQRSATGVWSAMGTGLDGQPWATAYDPNSKRIYVGGGFVQANGVVVNGIAYWNGTTFVAMDGGVGGGGAVYSIAVAANGDVWVAGSFPTVGTAAAATKGLARWNYATNTWTAFNESTTTWIQTWAVTIGPTGIVYVAGEFTNWEGDANSDYIVKTSDNGVNWDSLGTPPFSATYFPQNGQSLAVDATGTLFVGAANTGTAASYLHKFYAPMSAWTTPISFSPTLNGGIYALLFGPDGTLYLGGRFGSSGIGWNILSYDGVTSYSLGSGAGDNNTKVRALAWSTGFPAGLVAGGDFIVAGGLTVNRVALWNGASWKLLDVDLQSATAVWTLLAVDDRLYMGFEPNVTAIIAGSTSITNTGSANSFPIIRITQPSSSAGASYIYQIKNKTTGEVINLDIFINSGETITIDLSPGNKTITSSWHGNLIGKLQPGSNLTTFHLQPGPNSIIAYVPIYSGVTSVIGTIEWTPTYTAIESVIR